MDDDLKKLREEVAAYPTDLRRRFQLGAALSQRQKYYEAIPELQKGMMNPHVRLEAMKLLIDAYEALGQSDLAARVREQLSKESGDESGSGSAPVPAPTRPIAPRDSARAKTSLDENDAV
jgi:predicted Zn-dependent protease